METVAINFKGRGIKAHINKADFNPAVHKLWTEKNAADFAAPLAKKPVDDLDKIMPGETESGRPAKTKNAK